MTVLVRSLLNNIGWTSPCPWSITYMLFRSPRRLINFPRLCVFIKLICQSQNTLKIPILKHVYKYMYGKTCVKRPLSKRPKIVCEYDQEIPHSQTANNPVAPRGRAAQPSRDTRKTNQAKQSALSSPSR